jgi:hypothetical protein
MSKNEKKGLSSKAEGPLDKFEPGGESGPIEDRNEYEQRLSSLPPNQQELAQASTRFADLCQYFSQQKIDLPSDLLEQVGRLSRLAISERLRALKNINRELMEYLNDVGQDPRIRQ